ncbi:hypothetical protein Pan241w_50680 [Gimesia alba]|uniref:Uncharacterized protein n=1 Tax=Gimesia alba TaxID=2527973 RepID=A0A517RM33_9PLAN|nr:hypothetical protein [Gimesia alba]QDT44951.1 hypothetical protein Pan241w_50680 [Gimesia alba]
MNHSLKPKPSIPLVVCSILVLIASLILVALCIAMFFATWNPCSVFGGAILLPLPLVLAILQYYGTFHAKESAALTTAKLLFALGGFAFCAFIMTLGNLIFNQISLPWVSLLIPVLTFGVVALFLGWLNLGWSRQLKSSSPSKSHTINSNRLMFRDLITGMIALTGVTILVVYFVQSTAPQYAENIPYNKAPFKLLPAGASNVSFCQGPRGTIACEFTIDEIAFINWVDSGIGSLESQAANISLQSITTPYTIRRFNNLSSDLNGSDFATISEGLYYRWSKEDRGVYAAYDRTKNRAYYFAHYH